MEQDLHALFRLKLFLLGQLHHQQAISIALKHRGQFSLAGHAAILVNNVGDVGSVSSKQKAPEH